MSTPFAPGAIEAAVACLHWIRLSVATAAFLCVTTFACGVAAQSQERAGDAGSPARTRHILFLNSYQSGYHWSDDLVRGVTDVMGNQPFPVELWLEYMDSRRFSGPVHDDRFERFLHDKYRNHRFDLIISSDDAALTFLIERRDRLFPGIPVVFMGLNNWDLAARLDRRSYTGLREIFHTDTLVDTALAMRPETTRFVVIGDAAPTAAAQLSAIRTVAARRPDLEFVIHDGANIPLEEILAALARTTPTDAIITTSFTRDHTGRYFPAHEAILRILSTARGPVLSESACHVRQGILACAENIGLHHGTRGAEMAAAVLAGTPPESIPIESAEGGRVVIDYREVQRWGIDSRRLPADAVVIHGPSSFYQANKMLIWSGVSFILLQAVVIGALVVNISRRRQVEGKLAAQAKQLAMSNADLQLSNESLRKEMTERLHAEDQLRQAQKMEAIGRLAGGVAHDFNNLLTVIGGCAYSLVEAIGPTHPARRLAEEVQNAGERAATLTKQLLAFGRKQVLLPVTVSLNDVVRGVEPMLRRLLGEDLDLELLLTDKSTAMVVDAGQIEQVIVNLAINARDAMPHGGRLLIETRVLPWEALPDSERPDGPPVKEGQERSVVQLRVRDTGQGMDAHTRAHIFEPFFSTKGVKGTGLGLATVYGIVTQSGGAITVRSELGEGATFIISLPRTAATVATGATGATAARVSDVRGDGAGPSAQPSPSSPPSQPSQPSQAQVAPVAQVAEPVQTVQPVQAMQAVQPAQSTQPLLVGKPAAEALRSGPRQTSKGKETVLLVEDEPAVRTLTAQMLRSQGYTVVEACSGDHAVSQIADFRDPIDLLLTDVVMPGMSGRQLALRLVEMQPGLKVLFMSGYTDNVMAQHGVLEPGTQLLQKPFTLHSLGDKVRAVLDARSP
jgi:signal transduction histidine kinase/ActR/RegA family two-component response regulator